MKKTTGLYWALVLVSFGAYFLMNDSLAINVIGVLEISGGLVLLVDHFKNAFKKDGFAYFQKELDEAMDQAQKNAAWDASIEEVGSWRDDVAAMIQNSFVDSEKPSKAFLAIEFPRPDSTKEAVVSYSSKANAFLAELKLNTLKDEIKKEYDPKVNKK